MIKGQVTHDPKTGLWMYDECGYQTYWEAYGTGVLGLCGCGSPAEAYNFLRKVLMICDRRGCHDTPQTKPWIIIEPEIADLVTKTNPLLVAHVLLHLLSDKDVIEHGGSVGGSWLTDVGNEIVDGPAAKL